MMMRYNLTPQKRYLRDIKKLCQKNKLVINKIESASDKLRVDPFQRELHTHKVSAVVGENAFSSRVTGDLRIIWAFDNETVILLLALGGHSGSKKVYK